MSVKIKAENCIKIYGDNPRQALKLLQQGASREEILKQTGLTVGVNNASFEVHQGQIFVLIGLSGSGKSTLLRCINGLLKIDEGSLLVDGSPIHEMGEKELRAIRGKKMSMVFQHFAILPNRTVRENVAFGLELAGAAKEARLAKADEALQTVGLETWSNRFPGDLSGGMKQRVGLARALAMESDILLMDEPFSALDALIRGEMQEELLSLQQQIKKTIVFVTHDLDEALRLGDQIAIMRDGVIEQIGTAEDILSSPANDYIANFLKGVDVSKILLAENLARRPRDIIHPGEGTLAALRKLDRADADYLFVLSNDRRVQGIIYLENVLELKERNEHSIASSIKEVPVVEAAIAMQDVYPALKDADKAVAVVDSSGKFLGEITRRSLLANLSERKGG